MVSGLDSSPVLAAPGVVPRCVRWSSLHLGVSFGDGCSWSHWDLRGWVALLASESTGELELGVLQQENIVVVKMHLKMLKLKQRLGNRSNGKAVPVHWKKQEVGR